MADDDLKVNGKCWQCGGSGPDYPASVLTGADAQGDLNTTPQGEPLEYFEDRLLCPYCIQSEKNRRVSMTNADKHGEQEAFMARVGFRTKTIS